MKFIQKILVVSLLFCSGFLLAQTAWPLSNENATPETQNLYRKLWKLLDQGIMFGHQDDLGYGVNWRMQQGRSDVKEVSGDYPAVFGWDLIHLEEHKQGPIDFFSFRDMKRMMEEVYNMGGINTISWHTSNPLTGKSAWDNSKGAVRTILPDGENHTKYLHWLDEVAGYLLSLKGKDKKLIPILFRPFHELTGSWFWWGKGNCTPEEFRQLWVMTYHYMTENKRVNNLIWVYNTADFTTENEFMEFYPGDRYVDIISFDKYVYDNPVLTDVFVENARRQFGIMDKIAREHHKIPALAETGYEQIPYNKFWTKTLMDAVGDYKISYILAWRNHGLTSENKMHYYVPYKGHPNEQNFRDFYNLKRTLFLKEIQIENADR